MQKINKKVMEKTQGGSFLLSFLAGVLVGCVVVLIQGMVANYKTS
jgi:formate/nitrite transporter FocA (FNT family)